MPYVNQPVSSQMQQNPNNSRATHPSAADLTSAVSAWQRLLGKAHVLDADEAQLRYGPDTSATIRFIPAALLVTDSSQLPAIMQIAQQFRAPVYPISTGKNWGYGSSLPATDGCTIIDLSRLQKIIAFDPEFGIATIEPGVTQEILEAYLEDNGFEYLVPTTGAGPSCSLLSNALERGYGVTPIVDHFSAVTDLEAVLADGSVYQTALREAGGDELANLFRWGLGAYLPGLFSQSGLGIVTRVSIVLSPRPQSVMACLFSLKDDQLLEPTVLAIRHLMQKLGGTIGAINLMNQHRVLSMTAPYPADKVPPGSVMPQMLVEELGRRHHIFPWTGFATLYGTEAMVRAAKKEIRAQLGKLSTRMLFVSPRKAEQLAQLAKWIPGKLGKGLQGMTSTLAKSLELVNGHPNETALPLAYWRQGQITRSQPSNPAKDGCGLIWYAPLVPMRPSSVRKYVEMVKSTTPRHGIEPLITLTTLSDRLFDSTVPLLFDKTDHCATTAAKACYSDLFNAGRMQGWTPYRFGIHSMQEFRQLTPLSSMLTDKIRSSLDPHDILSPGRYR